MSSMTMTDQQQQFINLLREMFQLDNTDLDFGIYRILNLKSQQVENFITEVLPTELEKVKNKVLERVGGEVQQLVSTVKEKLVKQYHLNFDNPEEVEAKVEQARQLGFEQIVMDYRDYTDAKKRLDALNLSGDMERDIYNDLLRFFGRYYDSGDFVTKPRAGESAYMIPYNGEEVKLYWANHDQYYIKTGENFKNYIFHNGASVSEERVTIEFRLRSATVAENNNKEEKGRVFYPAATADNPDAWFEWNAVEQHLTLWFQYAVPTSDHKQRWGEKQSRGKDNINERVMNELERHIPAVGNSRLFRFWEQKRKHIGKDVVRDVQYHLHRYTNENRFDYFIHKDLRRFLGRELDYYLKHEVLSLSFLNPEWRDADVQDSIQRNVLKCSALRRLALTIIDFLAELEDFQKRLWEKKKFVLESNYIITLNRIPDAVRAEILDHVAHDPAQKQVGQWQSLGFVAALAAGELRAFAETRPTLTIDTALLPANLKWRLVGAIENLDEQTDGILINSENWQALNFLMPKYKGQIKCTYIDPPYNTGPSEIVYKNDYKHSTWLTLMENRISAGKLLQDQKGVNVIAIDENEQEHLGTLIEYLYSNLYFQKTCITVIHNPSGQQGDNFSYCHEFAYFIYPLGKRYIGMENRADEKADIRPLRDVSKGNHLRVDAANCFYPILVKDMKVIGFGDVSIEDYHPTSANIQREDGVIEIYPIDAQGFERKWVFARNTVGSIINELTVEYNSSRKILDIIRTKKVFNYKTVWSDKKYSANSYGAKLLNNILGEQIFSFPKSIHTVLDCIKAGTNNNSTGYILDYFAGSGTTGHAVINLNREDGGRRKFILVEMGRYFSSVTKPRIEKVIYCPEWKDGKPVVETQGAFFTEDRGHIVQYFTLEQYEDTLNNIEFTSSAPGTLPFLDGIRYDLSYGVSGSLSLANITKFDRPFSYSMIVMRGNEKTEDHPVDLISTFNYLLGITVVQYVWSERDGEEYRVVIGKKGAQEYVIIWREVVTGYDFDAEKAWIEQQLWYMTRRDTARIFANGDFSFPAEPIEPEFLRLMNGEEM